jgi:hypothetical protein
MGIEREEEQAKDIENIVNKIMLRKRWSFMLLGL